MCAKLFACIVVCVCVFSSACVTLGQAQIAGFCFLDLFCSFRLQVSGMELWAISIDPCWPSELEEFVDFDG